MVFAPPQILGCAFAKFDPPFVLLWFDDNVKRPNVISYLFVKRCFEQPDAVPGMGGIIDLAAWWAAAQVVLY